MIVAVIGILAIAVIGYIVWRSFFEIIIPSQDLPKEKEDEDVNEPPKPKQPR